MISFSPSSTTAHHHPYHPHHPPLLPCNWACWSAEDLYHCNPWLSQQKILHDQLLAANHSKPARVFPLWGSTVQGKTPSSHSGHLWQHPFQNPLKSDLQRCAKANAANGLRDQPLPDISHWLWKKMQGLEWTSKRLTWPQHSDIWEPYRSIAWNDKPLLKESISPMAIRPTNSGLKLHSDLM